MEFNISFLLCNIYKIKKHPSRQAEEEHLFRLLSGRMFAFISKLLFLSRRLSP